ncbi:MAG: TlpA family protein disulfide reductase [Bdellovibrionaceae bacterium]|nr:TlpA family protein disulfide reductase [Pseudobdellovibrionaceae bacterium]
MERLQNILGNSIISRTFNTLIVLLFGLLIAQRLPLWLRMYQMEGQNAAASFHIQDTSGRNFSIPPKEKLMLVFWATWCGPCEVELARINKLIEKGHIAPHQVLAISSLESLETVSSFVERKKWKFSVALDENGEIAKSYGVQGTPTILLINSGGKIHWMTMGISPSLEWRVNSFFKDSDST